MKFTNGEYEVLKNFASINQSMVFRPGNTIRTISQSKAVLASATISDEIEIGFAIYDMNMLLSALSLFSDPELEVTSKVIKVADEKSGMSFNCSDPSLILNPPEKNVKLPSVDVEFDLSNQDFEKVKKALGVLRMPEIAFVGDGERVKVVACNSKDKTSSNFFIDVGETDLEFKLYFLAENLSLLPHDYKVTVCSKGLAQFDGNEISYWVAVESGSEFPK
jgi:hypothetical protein